MKKQLIYAAILILVVILIDQWLKIWVKTNMYLSEETPVIGNWFFLHFTENPGFAFGTEIGGRYGKLGLSLFRLVAIGLIGYILHGQIKQKKRIGFILMISLILAGAIGNILDSSFYGLIFSESRYGGEVAQFLPAGGGYDGLFYGKVVDMLYFPIIKTFMPDWVPMIGGEFFIFFAPIFNIADSAISIGVISILIFFRKELGSFS